MSSDLDTSIAIRQGHHVRVCAKVVRIHAGGGRRGKQHGHKVGPARALENFLLKCREPACVLWLTFGEATGPAKVHKYVKAFLKRIERRLGRLVSAVSKMELQGRLSAEITILLWVDPRPTLDAAAIQSLWEATIGGQGRIEVQKVRSQTKLTSYVSKTITITGSAILVGKKKRYPLSKRHKSETSFPEEQARRTALFNEWCGYEKHFAWKHRKELIPQQEIVKGIISKEEADALRGEINQHRKKHFVGPNDGFTMPASAITQKPSLLPDALKYPGEHVIATKPDTAR